jgi:MFS superfamily sulfate permease-like transporter
MMTQFEYADDPDRIVIDMSAFHIWDASTVATLDAITNKYERHDKRVVIEGLNEASHRTAQPPCRQPRRRPLKYGHCATAAGTLSTQHHVN